MGAKRHRHEFTALSWHFGAFGDQTVHVHSCFTDDCDRVLIGPGRNCSGNAADHRRETLSEGKRHASRPELDQKIQELTRDHELAIALERAAKTLQLAQRDLHALVRTARDRGWSARKIAGYAGVSNPTVLSWTRES